MKLACIFPFALPIVLATVIATSQGCAKAVENNVHGEAGAKQLPCDNLSEISDASKSPWTDSSLNAIKKEWEALNARPPSRTTTKGDEFKYYALDDIFRMSLSRSDLVKLALTCPGVSTPPLGHLEFETQLVPFIIASFVHSGDRENLVKILSAACPGRAWGKTPIEYFVARYGSGRLSDPISVFADAYARSNSKEVRHSLASAVRRAFFSTGIRSKDDAELIKRSIDWYKENRANLVVNSKYRDNDDKVPLETYDESVLNLFDASPAQLKLEPLFTLGQPKITSEQHFDETINLPMTPRIDDKTRATVGRQMNEEKDLLQGRWQAVGLTSFGKQLPKDRFEGLRVVINGNQFQEVDKRDLPTKYTMSICVNEEPHTMNLRSSPYSDAKWQWTMLAIYKLEGDQLKICFSHPLGGPRPLDFKSDPDWCEEVMDLERVK